MWTALGSPQAGCTRCSCHAPPWMPWPPPSRSSWASQTYGKLSWMPAQWQIDIADIEPPRWKRPTCCKTWLPCCLKDASQATIFLMPWWMNSTTTTWPKHEPTWSPTPFSNWVGWQSAQHKEPLQTHIGLLLYQSQVIVFTYTWPPMWPCGRQSIHIFNTVLQHHTFAYSSWNCPWGSFKASEIVPSPLIKQLQCNQNTPKIMLKSIQDEK